MHLLTRSADDHANAACSGRLGSGLEEQCRVVVAMQGVEHRHEGHGYFCEAAQIMAYLILRPDDLYSRQVGEVGWVHPCRVAELVRGLTGDFARLRGNTDRATCQEDAVE